ncbi:MAG: hypothetical protein AAGJ93_16970 [Bacteroidota bacterium]
MADTTYTEDQIETLEGLGMDGIDGDYPIDDIAPGMLAAYAKAGGPDKFVMELVIQPAAEGEEVAEDPKVDGTTVSQVGMVVSISNLLSDGDDDDDD